MTNPSIGGVFGAKMLGKARQCLSLAILFPLHIAGDM
jgi:hypothetical protein